MKGYYDLAAVAKLLAVDAALVKTFVRAGFVAPEKNRDAWLFSFQDIVVLRMAKALREADIPTARIKRALNKLQSELPQGRPITSVRIAAEGGRIVVHDENTRYQPETGQLLFDFSVRDLAKKVAPIARNVQKLAIKRSEQLSAEDWYALGCELEVSSVSEARDAYRRAVELDPVHADAHNNLGRLLHETRELEAAEAQYRQAVESAPEHVTAWFNLGVVLEDAKKNVQAIEAYERAVALDPKHADAHYNAARLYNTLGRSMLALRHIRAYEKLAR